MQLSFQPQLLGPWGSDRLVSDVLTEASTDSGLAAWRALTIPAGGAMGLEVWEQSATSRKKKHRRAAQVGADITIGDWITAALASGHPILGQTVQAGWIFRLVPHTWAAAEVYVCPAQGAKHFMRDSPGFCPEDGLALVQDP